MNEQQNSTDPLREEFETAISELTPDERAELLKQYKAKKHNLAWSKRMGGLINERYQKRSAQTDSFSQ